MGKYKLFICKANKSIPTSIANDRFQLQYELTNININEHLAEQFIFYPNPAQDVVYFELPQHFDNGILRVYSLSGVLVKEQALDILKPELDVSHLRPGVYLIELRNDAERFRGKLDVE